VERTRWFRRLLIVGGIYNIVLAAPLVPPGLYRGYFDLLWNVNRALGLGGVRPIPPESGIVGFLVNTAGLGLVVIGVLVAASSVDPHRYRLIPLVNVVGRGAFVATILYYVVAYDIARIVLVVGSIDVVICLGFIYFLATPDRSAVRSREDADER
jgi:hypothetical protein